MRRLSSYDQLYWVLSLEAVNPLIDVRIYSQQSDKDFLIAGQIDVRQAGKVKDNPDVAHPRRTLPVDPSIYGKSDFELSLNQLSLDSFLGKGILDPKNQLFWIDVNFAYPGLNDVYHDQVSVPVNNSEAWRLSIESRGAQLAGWISLSKHKASLAALFFQLLKDEVCADRRRPKANPARERGKPVHQCASIALAKITLPASCKIGPKSNKQHNRRQRQDGQNWHVKSAVVAHESISGSQTLEHHASALNGRVAA